MNMRFQDLANKARKYYPKTTESGEFWVLDEQKFAQLIINECLQQIDLIRDALEEDKEYKQTLGADWAGLAVARHFGVE